MGKETIFIVPVPRTVKHISKSMGSTKSGKHTKCLEIPNGTACGKSLALNCACCNGKQKYWHGLNRVTYKNIMQTVNLDKRKTNESMHIFIQFTKLALIDYKFQRKIMPWGIPLQNHRFNYTSHINPILFSLICKKNLTWNNWELSSLGQMSLSPQNGLTVIVFSSRVGRLSL